MRRKCVTSQLSSECQRNFKGIDRVNGTESGRKSVSTARILHSDPLPIAFSFTFLLSNNNPNGRNPLCRKAGRKRQSMKTKNRFIEKGPKSSTLGSLIKNPNFDPSEMLKCAGLEEIPIKMTMTRMTGSERIVTPR